MSTGLPTTVNAMKPKYWLTGKLTVEPKTAVRLE